MSFRFLHTADWHLGRLIRGRSRIDELAAACDEVVRIAIDERVDAVLVAGDIHDSRAPSPDADHLFFEACLRLREARIPVVAIAGNHDSAARLAAVAPLLAAVGTTVVPQVAPAAEGGALTLTSRDGGTRAVVACLPFVPERRFGSAVALFEAPEEWYANYQRGVGGVIDALCGAFRDDAVNILMAHLYASGAALGGGEREVTIGLEYAISASQLPPHASYVALGHIHRPQPVPGAAAPARYAGSLLQLDFGETEQQKSVVVVEAVPGKPAAVRTVPLRAGRRLVDLRGTLDEVLAAGERAGDAFLRVFVAVDGPTPGLADRVHEALPNALDVHLEYERAEAPGREPVATLLPREQFRAYFRSHHRAEPTPELMGAFDEVLADVQGAG